MCQPVDTRVQDIGCMRRQTAKQDLILGCNAGEVGVRVLCPAWALCLETGGVRVERPALLMGFEA